MERRKRTSMYDPYREDIVAALEVGKTIIINFRGCALNRKNCLLVLNGILIVLEDMR